MPVQRHNKNKNEINMNKKIKRYLLPLCLPLCFQATAADLNTYYIYKKDNANYFETFSWAKAPKADFPKEISNNYGFKNKFNLLTMSMLKNKLKDTNYDLRLTNEKVNEMQTMAKYISDKYMLSLEQTEQVVYEVYKNAHTQNIEPHLILGLIDVESTFKTNAKNNGAKGLMQIIALYHPEEVNTIKSKDLDLVSVEGNIEVGVKVLSKYIKAQKGNISKALQMYNGSLNDKTQSYSRKVLTKMNMFAKVNQKTNISTT